MDKHYGLTNKPNEGVKDKAPSWMDELFKKQLEKTASKSNTPFTGVNDKFLNPTLAGVENDVVCEKCGCKLKPTDVDVCEACTE